MVRTLDMFDKPRKKREWLMHVVDCANGNCGELEDGEQVVAMKCARCGHESGWISLPSVTAAKRGLPCPKCNTVPNAKLTRLAEGESGAAQRS